MVILAWNLDGVMTEDTMTEETLEASTKTKNCIINGRRYCKFFLRISKSDRRFVGCDHAKLIDKNKNMNAYLEELLGKAYRHVPTILYGCSDEFLKIFTYKLCYV